MISINEYIQRLSYSYLKDNRFEYYDKFKKNIIISKNSMENTQNLLIKSIILHAYNHTRYYKNLFDNAGIQICDINNKEDLRKIPTLTKDIIKKNISHIISDDHFSKNLFEVTSGGSTGNQAVILKSPYFEQMGRAASLRNNLLANWCPQDRVVWIWGAPYEHQSVNNSIKARLGIIVNRRLLFNAYRYSVTDFPLWVEQINSFKPLIIYGYASIILEFSKYILANNKELPTIKSVVTTTETLEHREVICKAFKSRVYNQYGCREIPAIAIESQPGLMHIADDNVALNMDDDGNIIITALHSFGFPLINYKLGDRGIIYNPGTIKTDLPFTSMQLSIGRTTDNFINRKGKRISSSALSTYISTYKPKVVEHQVVQCDYDKFIINCIPDETFNKTNYTNMLDKVFSEYFGDQIEIEVNIVSRIPVEKSGKKIMFKRTFQFED